MKLGRALREIECEGKPEYIDVYSMEKNNDILKCLTEENGIRFHGGISAERVLEVMGKSMAVIHTESFDESTKKTVSYSVSTKVADSLASGTCILAYGPSDVASIEYLKNHKAAYCITDDVQLLDGLKKLIESPDQREKIIANAYELAKKNHNQNEKIYTRFMRNIMRAMYNHSTKQANRRIYEPYTN